jgi:hypothetical protein
MLWSPSGCDNKQEHSSYVPTPKKKRDSMSLWGAFLLGWQMWVRLHCEISRADCQPSLPWTTNHWSHQQLDQQSASLHALGRQAHVQKVKPTKSNTQQGVLCIINWIKLYIITKFDQHSKGVLPFMKWPAHEILSAMLRCLTMSLYKCWMHMQIVNAFSLLDILVLMACTSVSSHMYNSQTLAYTLCSRGCVHQIQFLYAQKDQH